MQKYATAGDAENLKKLIAEFYYGKPEEIELKEGGLIIKNGREMSTKWMVKKGRWVFYKE